MSLVTLATNPFIVSILYLFCVPEGKSCVKRSTVLPRVKRNRLVFVPDFTRDYFLSNPSRRNVELRSVLIKPLTPRTSYSETDLSLELLNLWTKSYGVTNQMKPLEQYFHLVLFFSL